MAVPVNEIFTTIQGEATYTGTPATFVRLQGCDVGCGWCDTKHTWEVLASDRVRADEMLNKTCDSAGWSLMSENDLLNEVKGREPKHIVITGGEPCEYDLVDLTTALIDAGYTVQIETSGTKTIKAHDKTFITLSPKWDMDGGLEVIDKNYNIANEVKVPVGKQADVDKLFTKIPQSYTTSGKTIWLQPLSQSKKATQLCIDTATKFNFRISIQTHKFIGIR